MTANDHLEKICLNCGAEIYDGKNDHCCSASCLIQLNEQTEVEAMQEKADKIKYTKELLE